MRVISANNARKEEERKKEAAHVRVKDIELREENKQFYENEREEISKHVSNSLVEEIEPELQGKDNIFAQFAESTKLSQKVNRLILVFCMT